TLLLGAEWSQSQLTFPTTAHVITPGVPQVMESGWNERFGRTYLSWLPVERLAFNAAVEYEPLNRSESAVGIDSFLKIQLLRAPVELRYFDPNGLFGLVRTTIVGEHGQFLDVTTGKVSPGKGTFATLDLGIGWRFPGRPFLVTFEAANVLDSHFKFQDTDSLNEQIFP